MKKPVWSLIHCSLFIVLTLVMTYPVIAHPNTHLVGFGDDMWVHYWNNWWVKKVLTEGGSVYSTGLLFHPQTVSLVYHNFGWVNVAGWLLLEPIVSGIAASNLVYLANVTLCAFAMFLLARHLLKSAGAAFIAGLVYGYWPYRLSDYGHPNMISTQWLPLALLCVILLVRDWQALRRMETSFKFFVHLDDAESGEPVAQADVMPHDWGYPTTWWEAGEVVSDDITLSLGDVPPGRYRLWVGVYHPDTGERLPISGVPTGFVAEGGRLALREGIIR